MMNLSLGKIRLSRIAFVIIIINYLCIGLLVFFLQKLVSLKVAYFSKHFHESQHECIMLVGICVCVCVCVCVWFPSHNLHSQNHQDGCWWNSINNIDVRTWNRGCIANRVPEMELNSFGTPWTEITHFILMYCTLCSLTFWWEWHHM